MRNTIADLLQLAAGTPELARRLEALAAEYGLEIQLDPDALSDDELEAAAGGVDVTPTVTSTAGEFVDSPMTSPAPPPPAPEPYPNTTDEGSETVKVVDGESGSSGEGSGS